MRRPPRKTDRSSVDRSPAESANRPDRLGDASTAGGEVADGDELAAGGSTDRAIFGLIRLLLFVVLVVLAGVAVAVVAPDIVDEYLVEQPSVQSEPPPSAGDRSTNLTHTDDPGNTSYEAAEEIRSEHVEDFIHHEVNEIRADHDLEPLEWDGTIASVSRAHSGDMAERGFFSHENPDGESPFDRFDTVADYCEQYGENIAQSWVDRPVAADDGSTVTHETAQSIAEGLVGQWMDSTPHREAILESNDDVSWDRGGIGVYITEDGEVFATQNFCNEW